MKTRFFYFKNGSFGQGEETVPEPADNQLLVKTVMSLVSVGTETAANTGNLDWKEGRHGYSNVGRVLEVGSKVEGWKVGDRVFSQQCHVDAFVARPDEDLYHIPDAVPDEAAVFTTLGIVALHVVQRASISMGRPVVVMGLGTVGQLTWQLARLAGAGMVIGVELDSKKRDLAKKLGISNAIAPEDDLLRKALAQAPENSAPPIFIDVTGSSKAVEWAVLHAPLHACVVLGGGYTAMMTLDPRIVGSNEIQIIVAHQPKCPQTPIPYYPFNRDFNHRYVLDALADGRLKAAGLSDALFKPDDLIDFYNAGKERRPRPNQPIIVWE